MHCAYHKYKAVVVDGLFNAALHWILDCSAVWSVECAHQMNNVLAQCLILLFAQFYWYFLIASFARFVAFISKIEWSIVGGNCSRSNSSSGRCLSYALIRMNEKENTKNEIMVFYGFLVFGYNLWLNSLLRFFLSLAHAFHLKCLHCISTSFEYFMSIFPFILFMFSNVQWNARIPRIPEYVVGLFIASIDIRNLQFF